MQRFLKHDEPALTWTGGLFLDGRLTIPRAAAGLILMPGIGGMLHHDGVRALAEHFHDNGFATLIADLLTPDEQELDARTRHFRTDVPLLAERIEAMAGHAGDLPIAFFGSGLVGSAAIVAASMGTDLFALTITCPRLGVLRSLAPGLERPTLLILDETASAPRTAGIVDGETRIDRVASVTLLLESHAAVEELARKALVWFRNHAPVVAGV